MTRDVGRELVRWLGCGVSTAKQGRVGHWGEWRRSFGGVRDRTRDKCGGTGRRRRFRKKVSLLGRRRRGKRRGVGGIWRVLYGGLQRARAEELLYGRVVEAQGGLGLLGRGLGVGLIGVLALADGLEDTGGVPLCKLDLLQRLGVGRAPFAGEVEKSGCRVKGVGRLSVERRQPSVHVVVETKRRNTPRHFVCAQSPLGAAKRVLGKLLDVCLAGVIVHDGVVVGALSLCSLEALNERLCKVEAVVVGRVQALADDLVDGMVLACEGVREEGRGPNLHDWASRGGRGGTNTSRRWRA